MLKVYFYTLQSHPIIELNIDIYYMRDTISDSQNHLQSKQIAFPPS